MSGKTGDFRMAEYRNRNRILYPLGVTQEENGVHSPCTGTCRGGSAALVQARREKAMRGDLV